MKKYLFMIPRLCGGGSERVMTTIANGLCTRADVTILTLTTDECFYRLDERVRVVGLGRTVDRKNKLTAFVSELFGGFAVYFRINKEIKSLRPDAILSFMVHTNILAILSKLFGRARKLRVVLSERADPWVRSALHRWFEKRFYVCADAIICQGNEVSRFFSDACQKKITVIPNPLCSEAIPAVFTGTRRKAIVGIGRLFPQKNFEMLINAFAALDKRFSDYSLEIYGSGYLEETLNRQIRQLGLTDRARLMGTRTDVMYMVVDASLFVMSSDFEGFPNVLVEAMGSGLPVISTNFSTGIAHELIGSDNGIVVPVGDQSAFTAAMNELLGDNVRRQKMSTENSKILNKLDETKIVEIWREILDK